VTKDELQKVLNQAAGANDKVYVRKDPKSSWVFGAVRPEAKLFPDPRVYPAALYRELNSNGNIAFYRFYLVEQGSDIIVGAYDSEGKLVEQYDLSQPPKAGESLIPVSILQLTCP
jgi:hypothetical protein